MERQACFDRFSNVVISFIETFEASVRESIETFNNVQNSVGDGPGIGLYIMPVKEIFTGQFFFHVRHDTEDAIIFSEQILEEEILVFKRGTSGVFFPGLLSGPSAEFFKEIVHRERTSSERIIKKNITAKGMIARGIIDS